MNDHGFTWLPPELREHVARELAAPMPRGRGELRHRARPRGLRGPVVDGKAHVVFVAYYPNASTIRKSIALRDTGRFHTTLIACCIREDAEIGRWFDQAYELEDYGELLDLMHGAAPTAVNVHVHQVLPAVLAMECVAPERIVIDLYDSKLFMEKEESSDAALERAVLARAGHFVHKMPPQAVTDIRRAWDIATPDTLVHSLPYAPFFAEQGAREPGPVRLAFAGGVMPYHIAVQQGHGNHVFDPIIEAADRQGLHLSFFVNQNARDMYWDEHQRYVDMQERHPGFRFHRGVPLHRLPQALAGHDFGLLYDNVDRASYPMEHFRYNMSTKVFSYLEAGLPILVYDDFEYIAEMVERHHMGLVYDIERLDDLGALIGACDHERLAAGADAFRRSHELATLRETLAGIYGAQGAAA